MKEFESAMRRLAKAKIARDAAHNALLEVQQAHEAASEEYRATRRELEALIDGLEVSFAKGEAAP